ncbi:MAG: DNA repair protein RadC [Candidatus Binatia bacterium]
MDQGRVSAWPKSERPRERLFALGATTLSDGELLGLVFGAGHRGSGNAVELGRQLLRRFGDLRGLVCASASELASSSGIGAARAASIIAVGEIARRLESESLDRGASLSSSSDVHAHFGPMLADHKRELFYVLLLDGKNRLLSKRRVSEGSLGASLVHPREAFRPAIREAAAAVIFLHNHPSGDPSPSLEDKRITERLKKAGELLGIPVLDHVVVARRDYYSFADTGWV